MLELIKSVTQAQTFCSGVQPDPDMSTALIPSAPPKGPAKKRKREVRALSDVQVDLGRRGSFEAAAFSSTHGLFKVMQCGPKGKLQTVWLWKVTRKRV